VSLDTRKLSDIDPLSLAAIFNQDDLEEVLRIHLRMEFATTETEVHQEDLIAGPPPMAQELLAAITSKVMSRANRANVFAELYPMVRQYVSERCFGKTVDIDSEAIRSHLLSRPTERGAYFPR